MQIAINFLDRHSDWLGFIIWALGGVLLYFIYEWQKELSEILGWMAYTVIYLVGFFYFLALGFINDFMDSLITKLRSALHPQHLINSKEYITEKQSEITKE